MLKAVFFDVYGTVADFQPSRYQVQSQACAEFGIEVTPEGIRQGYAAADAYMTEQNSTNPVRLRDEEGKARFFGEYERLVLQGNGVKVSRERAFQIFRRLQQIPYGLEAFDDVVPVLRHLRSLGLRLGMISNINQGGAELTASLGLTSHLDFTVTSGEVGAEKPHPAIFRAALKRADIEPSQAIHVGDQPSSDVEGALGVGITPVLLDRDGNHPCFNRCPRIESLRELPALVEEKMQGSGC